MPKILRCLQILSGCLLHQAKHYTWNKFMLRIFILLCSVSPILLLQICISSSLTGVIRSDSSRLEIYTYIWAGLPHPLAADFRRQNMYCAWERLCREQHTVADKDAWNGEWWIQPEPFLPLATDLWSEGSVLTHAVGVLCALPGRSGTCKCISWTHSPRKTTEIIQPMGKKDFAKTYDRLSHE